MTKRFFLLLLALQFLSAQAFAGANIPVNVTAGTPDILITPSPGTGTFTVGSTALINAQGTTTPYTILATDMGKTVTHNKSTAVAVTLPQAGTTGFGAGVSYSEINIGTGTVTVTPTTSTINGKTTLALTTGQSAYFISDGSNWWAFLGASTGSGGSSGQILPSSTYTTDTAGNLFPYVYTGGGSNASKQDAVWGVASSLGADATLALRFQMPSVLPSGTFKLVSYCLANASSGVVKYTVSDADVGAGSSPSGATLSAETQTSITWSVADVYVVTKTTLTSVPVANDVSVVAVAFNHTGWTLAATLGCRWGELFE